MKNLRFCRYHELLTPFIFAKIEAEYKLREKVLILKKDGDVYTTQSDYKVTDASCTCAFFTAMILPCKHIFTVLEIQQKNVFVPALCCERWTKSFYQKSHPSLAVYGEIQPSKPIHVQTMRIPSEIDKYKKMNKVSKEICNMGSGMSTSQYQYFVEKMTTIRDEINDRN